MTARLVGRLLWAQIRRGTAPFAALAAFGTTLGLYAAHPGDWAGRWTAWALYSRTALIILCPVAVMLGTWQAGREHRRRTAGTILLAPRPVWWSRALTCLAVSAGLLAGSAAALGLLAAVDVAPLATYAGGGWWWPLLVGVPGLLAASSLGIVVGTWVRWRIAAPVAGLLTYVLLASTDYVQSATAWLAPNVDLFGPDRIAGAITGWQAVWFVGLAVVAVLAASVTGRRPVRAVVGALALAGAVTVLAGSAVLGGPAQDPQTAARQDPEAIRPACVERGDLSVCATQDEGFLLPQLADRADHALGRFSGLPGFPRAVHTVEIDPLRQVDDPTVLTADYSVVGGLVSRPRVADGYEANLVTDLFTPQCLSSADYFAAIDDFENASLVAKTWAAAQEQGGSTSPGKTADRTWRRLHAAPHTTQLAWVGRYLTAARSCDTAAGGRLGRPDSVHP